VRQVAQQYIGILPKFKRFAQGSSLLRSIVIESKGALTPTLSPQSKSAIADFDMFSAEVG
jgi:hypothetical protein